MVVCRNADQEFEFKYSASCVKMKFDQSYIPAGISMDDNKIVIFLKSVIGSTMSSFRVDGKWRQQYIKDFVVQRV